MPAPVEYVQMLAAFAKQHGILFIADEIQTGFGRTGKLFASEHYDLVPDIITTAKSLAGGLPLAAVTGRADVMEASHVGGLGGTYGGNPLACAAALAVIDAMETERIPARAARAGARIADRFRGWAREYPCIGDVRGLGRHDRHGAGHRSREPRHPTRRSPVGSSPRHSSVASFSSRRDLWEHDQSAGPADDGRRDRRRGAGRVWRGARGAWRLGRRPSHDPRSGATESSSPRKSAALPRVIRDPSSSTRGLAGRCSAACRCTG